LPLRERPRRPLVAERHDRGVDAAGPAARRELHDQLLEATEAETVDEVGHANAHAGKLATALSGGYAAGRWSASIRGGGEDRAGHRLIRRCSAAPSRLPAGGRRACRPAACC